MVNDSTAYTVKVVRKQAHVEASVVGQASAAIAYDLSSGEFGTGQSGLYSDKTSVTFDNFKAYVGYARDAMVPRIGGPADTSVRTEKERKRG